MIEECNIPIIISGRRTNTDLKFKFVLANPMTGKVKKVRVLSVIPFYK